MHNLTSTQAGHLYTLLIGETVSQFRLYFRHTQRSEFQDVSSKIQATKCPACPKNADVSQVITVSMDANFGLVRKSNAGNCTMPPLYKDVYFLDGVETHNFVNSYGNDGTGDKECSHFLAGDAVRSRSRNANLDVRAVFGSVCRHEYPVLFMDMRHGERLAYPILLLRKLLSSKPEDCKLQIIYDIGCVLTRHMKNYQQDLLAEVTVGVPVFHAYGHGASCQVNFSCRHLAGFGLTDGEGTERLWSYLRPLAVMTKEMTPGHRIDMLNDALLHYAMRKTAGIARWLEMRAQRAESVEKESANKLNEFMKEMGVTSVDPVKLWREQYKLQLEQNKTTARKRMTWQSAYVAHLKEFYHICSSIESTSDAILAKSYRTRLEVLTSTLQQVENTHKLTRWLPTSTEYLEHIQKLELDEKEKMLHQLQRNASERGFLVSLLSKYSSGQKAARRMSCRLKQATNTVRKGVSQYNAKIIAHTVSVPEEITFEQAADPNSSIYSCISVADIQDDRDTIPFVLKLRALELLDIQDRALEEKSRVSEDIWCTLISFTDLHSSLSAAATAATSIGVRALLLKQLFLLEQFLRELWSVTGKFLRDIPTLPTYEGLPEVADEMLDISNDLLLDSDDDDFSDDDE